MIQTMNTVLVVIPGGKTSKLHILVNKPLNDQLKQLYSEWILVGEYVLTPQGQYRSQCKTTVPVDPDDGNRSLQK
jgi:hypothetical protein